MEAAEDFGALIAVQFALELGREGFAVPGNTFKRNSQGHNKPVQQGAKIVLSAEDVLEELNLKMVGQHPEARAQLSLFDGADATERKLWERLSAGPRPADELSVLTGRPISQVSSALAMRELTGMARQVGDLIFSVAREKRVNYTVE